MKTEQKIFTRLALLLIAGALTFTSCRKKEESPEPEEEDTEQSTATDNNLAENTVNDIISIGSEISESGTLESFRPSGPQATSTDAGIASAACASVTGLGTKTITVDFGTTGCLCQDGKTRSGKIVYNFSASSPTTAIYYRNPGFSMTVSTINYVVDGYQINIHNKTVTNTTPSTISPSVNPGTNLTWAITASVTIIRPSSTGTISWSCSRTKELINTSDTNCYKGQARHIRWNKAIIKLNGTASGVNAKQENYTAVATNLIRDFNCSPDVNHPRRHPFISGTISYTPGIRPVRLIDFGNGSCDLNATVTIKGKVHNITL